MIGKVIMPDMANVGRIADISTELDDRSPGASSDAIVTSGVCAIPTTAKEIACRT
jgi:hypothetical protein